MVNNHLRRVEGEFDHLAWNADHPLDDPKVVAEHRAQQIKRMAPRLGEEVSSIHCELGLSASFWSDFNSKFNPLIPEPTNPIHW